MEIVSRAQLFHIYDLSCIGDLRRSIQNWCISAKLTEVKAANVSIVINELATNIVKHAQRGVVICTEDEASINILALDNGSGEFHPRAFEDGFSTIGTAGTGLGAIQRLSDFCEFYVLPGKGSAFLSVFRKDQFSEGNLIIKGFSLPLKGEEVSGDQWIKKKEQIMVADGLGHGLLAHQAAREAVSEFIQSPHTNPLNDLNLIHQRLRSTRGAAVAVTHFQREKKILEYAALGNISGSIFTPRSVKRLVTYNGTAGVQLRKIMALPYPWSEDSLLILHSDGLSTHWDLKDYPGLFHKHPLLIAGILYRDFYRGNDDVTVVVAKEN